MTQPNLSVSQEARLPSAVVLQKEPNGCVAAILATMLGCTYDEAATMITRCGDCYSTISRQLILFEQGWAKCERGRQRPDNTRRDTYPLEPFAPIHIVSVKVSEGSPVYHSVIWLSDGSVLDPMTPEPKRLSDYHHIGGIDGWAHLSWCHPPQAFQRAIAQADAAERERVRTVFLPAILHGDEAHRGWLAAAVDAYIAGTPIPPPTGKGNSEAADAAGYRRAVEEAAAWHDNKAVAARKKSNLRMNLALVAARIHDESALAIRALAEPKG